MLVVVKNQFLVLKFLKNSFPIELVAIQANGTQLLAKKSSDKPLAPLNDCRRSDELVVIIMYRSFECLNEPKMYCNINCLLLYQRINRITNFMRLNAISVLCC